MNFYLLNVLIVLALSRADGGLFDRFSGNKLDSAQANVTEQCSMEIKSCTPHEGSRIDGTCNNYKHPSRGSAGGPYLRLLKPDYGYTTNIRMNKRGEPLPSARQVRTSLQTTGRVDKSSLTAAAAHYLEFIRRDVSFASKDFLRDRQHCCQETGKSDPHCIPIIVPKDDPYLKVTDIRCLNFSRAQTFQESGCSPEIIPPEQINFQTPLLDLSTAYGVDDNALAKIRKGEFGMLILESMNQKSLPQNMNDVQVRVPVITKENLKVDSIIKDANIFISKENDLHKPIMVNDNKTETENMAESVLVESKDSSKLAYHLKAEDVCIQNKVNKTTCYQFGFPEAGNYDLRTTALGIFFMREHNRIAEVLLKINPCWKDDRLFKVARQINIATASNIFMYELLPILLGYKNMLNYEFVSDHVVHVTSYDEDVPPQVYAEYEIAVRYFHTLLDGRIKLYTENHHYKGELSHSETLYRQELMEHEKHFEEINRGIFFQSSAKIDDIQDPEISEHFYGDLQKAHDLAAIDIQRGRDMGLRGYNDYRHLCGIKAVKEFDDLLDVMDVEKVDALRHLYEEVDDIDLIAGIISENLIEGTYVGPTLYCIMAKQLQIFKYSDRFWYERGDQFHSFSLGQLHEIRKTNMARLACDTAEGIQYIQPQAFLLVKPGNTLMPCTRITGADLTKWRDSSCTKNKYSTEDPQTDLPMSFMFQGSETNFSSFFDDLLFYKPSDQKENEKEVNTS